LLAADCRENIFQAEVIIKFWLA